MTSSNTTTPKYPCPRCHSTGDDPTGWTLAAARKTPKTYHQEMDAARDDGAFSLMPDVVSPIPFNAAGIAQCAMCAGRGYLHVDRLADILSCAIKTTQPSPKRTTL